MSWDPPSSMSWTKWTNVLEVLVDSIVVVVVVVCGRCGRRRLDAGRAGRDPAGVGGETGLDPRGAVAEALCSGEDGEGVRITPSPTRSGSDKSIQILSKNSGCSSPGAGTGGGPFDWHGPPCPSKGGMTPTTKL